MDIQTIPQCGARRQFGPSVTPEWRERMYNTADLVVRDAGGFIFDGATGVALHPADIAAERQVHGEDAPLSSLFAGAARRMSERLAASPDPSRRAMARHWRNAYPPPRPADTRPATKTSTSPGRKPGAATRPQGARREHRARGAKVSGGRDPGDPDGDSDSDDPVGEAIERLLGSAPPFSNGQARLLSRLLGGVR